MIAQKWRVCAISAPLLCKIFQIYSKSIGKLRRSEPPCCSIFHVSSSSTSSHCIKSVLVQAINDREASTEQKMMAISSSHQWSQKPNQPRRQTQPQTLQTTCLHGSRSQRALCQLTASCAWVSSVDTEKIRPTASSYTSPPSTCPCQRQTQPPSPGNSYTGHPCSSLDQNKIKFFFR